jgi:predicted membrane-bound spermidine synthase
MMMEVTFSQLAAYASLIGQMTVILVVGLIAGLVLSVGIGMLNERYIKSVRLARFLCKHEIGILFGGHSWPW